MLVNIILLVTWLASSTDAFNVAVDNTFLGKRGYTHFPPLYMSKNDGMSNNDTNEEEEENLDDLPIIAQSTVKIDDGGSDLTDRFKYKVTIKL